MPSSRVIGVAGLLMLAVAPARAEQVELVTYYPAPAAAATDTEPPKPYRFYFSQPIVWTCDNQGKWWLSSAQTGIDVYNTLELWRFGVTRSQIQLIDWEPKGERRWPGTGGSFTVTFSAPSFGNGVIDARPVRWDPSDRTNHFESAFVYWMEFTW